MSLRIVIIQGEGEQKQQPSFQPEAQIYLHHCLFSLNMNFNKSDLWKRKLQLANEHMGRETLL